MHKPKRIFIVADMRNYNPRKMFVNGMQRAHNKFNCERIAQCVLDLIETGTYDASWAEVL